jgi:hypothetical protein
VEGPATVTPCGPGDGEGVENKSKEISSFCMGLTACSSGGGESEASWSVSEGGAAKILMDCGEGGTALSNIVPNLIAISVLLGIWPSGNPKWSIEDGKETSFKGEDVKEGVCRVRGGGEGLSCALMIRLASMDEGSIVGC